MNLSDVIEAYIKDMMVEEEIIEMKRSEIASHFNCVPSQINYVISTRFIPQLGFYVESRRGGGGYIKISKVDMDKKDYLLQIFEKTGDKLSQSVVDIYLAGLMEYNMIDAKTCKLIKVAVSDKSLARVNIIDKDKVRADIFKYLVINAIE